jgi:hypothetical protein
VFAIERYPSWIRLNYMSGHWIFTKSHNETLFSTFFLIFIIPYLFYFFSSLYFFQHADVHATACWRIGSYAPACVPYFVCLNIKISRLVYNRDYINFTSFRFLGRRFSKIERVVFTFQCYDKLHHWHKRAAFVFVILVHCARNSLFT